MKIKQTIIFLFVILISSGLRAQTEHSYTVIGTKGSVISKKAGKELQTGDVISGSDDEFTFKDEKDMAGLVRDDGRRFVLLNRKEKRNYKCPMDAAIMIGKTRFEWKNLTIKTLEELQQLVTEVPFVFLDTVAKIKLDQKTFPQHGKSFFYFEYKWKNPKGKAEIIPKKLQSKKDTLLMKHATIFKVDNSPVNPKDVSEFKLLYMNGGEPVLIGDFNVNFPDAEKIKNEIGILVKAQQKVNFQARMIQGEVEAYIRQFYGSIDRINLINYLKNNFGVPEK